MPRVPECDRCSNNAHSDFLLCAVRPLGPQGASCPDFAVAVEELWEPPGARYLDGQLILHRPSYMGELQPEIDDNHPMLTGICPRCGAEFRRRPLVHYDCTACGWLDDSV